VLYVEAKRIVNHESERDMMPMLAALNIVWAIALLRWNKWAFDALLVTRVDHRRPAQHLAAT
jgi:hypothetical protein